MRILLLGKNGQVGRELEKQSKMFGFTTVAYSREELDITDWKKLKTAVNDFKPNFVINASAYHVVPDCEQFPDKAFAINTISVKQLAEICEEANSRLVHYSTDYVFDGLKGKPYKEEDNPNPLQMYGVSKLAGEYAALHYAKNSIIIRGAYIYGGVSGSRSKKGNFVLTMLRQTDEKDSLEVSSEQIVSPTYSSDLAKATFQLLKIKEAQGIYHLSNSGKCSLAEFTEHIIKIKKRRTKIIPVDRGGMAGSLHRPTYSALQNTRAKKLGVILPSWKDALTRYINTLQ
jgi:dTDP-4-dehydrorhamnose reductase